MRKKILAISLLLIYVLIANDNLISKYFLHQLYITQKVIFPDSKLATIVPEARFALVRSLSWSWVSHTSFLANISKTIKSNNFFTRVFSFGTDPVISDKGFLALNMPIIPSFSLLVFDRGSPKCWLSCQSAWLHSRRQLIIAQQRFLLTDSLSGLVAALTLGSRDTLPPQLRQLFTDLGLQHLLAPSGYHLGLFLIILGVFMPRSLPQVVKNLTLIFASGYLVLLSGWRISLIRAWSMWLLSVLSWQLFRRPQPAILRLGVTVLLFIFLWPAAITSISFRLSVVATLGIILYVPIFLPRENFFLQTELGETPYLRKNFFHWWQAVLAYSRGILVVGTIAQLWIAPLVFEEFASLQLFSPLATLLLAWLLPILLFFGLLIVILSPLIAVVPGLARLFFLIPAWLVGKIWDYEFVLLTWLRQLLPGQLVWHHVPSWWRWLWWGSLIFVRLIWWIGTNQQRKQARRLL